MIIFIHHGPPPPFLIAAIFQARAADPDCGITLFTDQPQSTLSFLNKSVFLEKMPKTSSRLERFRKAYRHSGRNTFEYTRRNFERWLIIADWAEFVGHRGPLIHLDSDAFLLMPFDEISNSVEGDVTVTNNVGPQFSFFRSAQSVVKFSDFLLETYEEDANYQALETFVQKFPGQGVPHVSDMAFFGFFGERHEVEDTGDSRRRNFLFDENIGESQGLQLGLLGKTLKRRAGRRYFKTLDGDLVLAGGLHLQGGNKALWPIHVVPSVHGRFFITFPRDYVLSLLLAVQKAALVIALRLSQKLRDARRNTLLR